MWAGCIPLDRRAKLCLLGAIASVLCGLLLGVLLPMPVKGVNAFWGLYALAALGSVLLFGAPAALLYARSARAWDGLRRALAPAGPVETGLTLLTAVSYTLLGALITGIWLSVLTRYGIAPQVPSLPNPAAPVQYVYAFVCAALIPAVCEELAFRGLLLTWLRRRGDRLALVVSALVFALMHRSLQALPALFAMGLLLAAVAIRYRGLFLPMLLHFFYNLTAVVLNAAPGMLSPSTVLMSSAICLAAIWWLLRPSKEEPHGT